MACCGGAPQTTKQAVADEYTVKCAPGASPAPAAGVLDDCESTTAAASSETAATYEARKAATIKAMQAKTHKNQPKQGNGGEEKGVPPLVAAASSLISSAAAAAGQPEVAVGADLVEQVHAMLRSATNQAYATGLSGGGAQVGLGTREHADQLLALLLAQVGPAAATPGQKEDVRMEVQRCLGGLRNKAYAGGLARLG
jgi:hypothetical protein